MGKHDHQQYADHPVAATTRTTLVTRAIVVMCGMAAVAGVTYLSTGLYPRSPVVTNHRDSSPEDVLSLGATGGGLRDGSTSTPTQEAFMAQYSELIDISPADQTIQYEAYLLYLKGRRVVVRVRRVLFVVAKMNATVRDVRLGAIDVWPTRNMNVSLPDMGLVETVVVPFQITVWVANFGFLATVRNTLLEVIHTIESMPPHPYRPDRTTRHHQKIFSNE